MFSCWINYGYVCHHSKSNSKFFILLNSLFSNFLSVNLFLIASCSIKKLFNYLPFPDRNYPSSNTDRRDNYVTNLQNYITCCNVTRTRINHDTINIVVRLFLFRICRWLELSKDREIRGTYSEMTLRTDVAGCRIKKPWRNYNTVLVQTCA